MAEMSPSAGVVDELKAFPFLDNRILLDNLKKAIGRRGPNVSSFISWKCKERGHQRREYPQLQSGKQGGDTTNPS